MSELRNPKTDETIARRMSDEEAATICKTLTQDFPRSLAEKFPALSECQTFWMHKLAYGSLDGAESNIQLPEGAHRKLVALFTQGAEALRYPKLRYQTPDGTLRVSRTSRGIVVHCGDRFCGRVTENDVFEYTAHCPETTKSTMLIIGKSPILAAIAWGHKIGHCVFCGLELTDPRSVSMGYGPICAGNWGLPWGEATDAEQLLELVNLLENPRPVVSGESSK